MMLEDSFLKGRDRGRGRAGRTVADSDWETQLHWLRTNVILGESEVTVSWQIPTPWRREPTGSYTRGTINTSCEVLTSPTGVSSPFNVGVNLGAREEIV